MLILLVITSCQQGGKSAPEPQVTIKVELSATLQYLSPAIQACSLQENGMHIILEEKPASEMGKTGADVSLRWGDSGLNSAGRVFRLGSDRLVFAVHKENPLHSLTVEQASFLSKGRVSSWGNVLDQFCPKCSASELLKAQPVEPWQYPAGEDVALEIMSIPSISQTGTLNRVWVAPNPQALAEAVSNNTAAVGWLPARWLNNNLKEITLQAIDPAELVLPVLAITPKEPGQIVGYWLSCMQSSFNN